MIERRPSYRTHPRPTVTTSPRLATAALVHWTDDEPPDLAEIALDSESWNAWLSQGQGFRCTYVDSGQSVTFNVTPERRGSRLYWAAFKRIGGSLKKYYLGTSPKLTQVKLNEAGGHLLAIATEHAAVDPTAPLVEALSEYEILISELIPHLPAHLRRRARRETGRIKASVVTKDVTTLEL